MSKNCPKCGYTPAVQLMVFFSDGRDMFRCPKCGHEWLHPDEVPKMTKNDFEIMVENMAEAAREFALTSAEIEKRLQSLGKIMADWYEKYGWMFPVTEKKPVLKRIATWIRELF